MPVGRGPGRGLGRRQPGPGYGLGPGGDCVCPKCGHKEQHTIGSPCFSRLCPKCGTVMTRV